MKIFYSIDRLALKNDISSLDEYPIVNYSKSDILNGIALSNIALVFNYWNQDLLIVEDSLLSFHYNLLFNINRVINEELAEANTFSVEQGFSMKLKKKKKNIIIDSFQKTYTVNANEFKKALKKSIINAFGDLEQVYLGLSGNKYYIEIKNELLSETNK